MSEICDRACAASLNIKRATNCHILGQWQHQKQWFQRHGALGAHTSHSVRRTTFCSCCNAWCGRNLSFRFGTFILHLELLVETDSRAIADQRQQQMRPSVAKSAVLTDRICGHDGRNERSVQTVKVLLPPTWSAVSNKVPFTCWMVTLNVDSSGLIMSWLGCTHQRITTLYCARGMQSVIDTQL